MCLIRINLFFKSQRKLTRHGMVQCTLRINSASSGLPTKFMYFILMRKTIKQKKNFMKILVNILGLKYPMHLIKWLESKQMIRIIKAFVFLALKMLKQYQKSPNIKIFISMMITQALIIWANVNLPSLLQANIKAKKGSLRVKKIVCTCLMFK